MATTFQLSTKSASPEESDLLAAERNERDRICGYCTRLLLGRLASNFSLTLDGGRLPQSAATLGVHVGSFVRHLSQPEVADMVEGAITNCSFSMAVSSLSFRVAGNGCRSILGCDSARTAASAPDMAVGDLENDSRCDPALGGSTIPSARRVSSTRVDGNVGTHPSPSFRYFPNRRAPLAKRGRQCKSHHVCATPFHIPWGVLGKALKPRFPPAFL